MEILLRKQAYIENQTRYFTGKACRKGHLTHRYVNTGACVSCIADYGKKNRTSFENRKYMRHSIIVRLINAEDEKKIIRYVTALNMARELDHNNL